MFFSYKKCVHFDETPTIIYNVVIEHSMNATAAEPASSMPSNEKEVQTISQTVVMTLAASESRTTNGDPLEATGSLPNGNVHQMEQEIPIDDDDVHEGRRHHHRGHNTDDVATSALFPRVAFDREAAEVLITTSNKGRNGSRLPPPRTLRKCVLINNDCKYSLQKPTVIIRK